MLRLSALRAELDRHNHLYYVLNQPSVSDARYDALMDKMLEVCDRIEAEVETIKKNPALEGFDMNIHMNQGSIVMEQLDTQALPVFEDLAGQFLDDRLIADHTKRLADGETSTTIVMTSK